MSQEFELRSKRNSYRWRISFELNICISFEEKLVNSLYRVFAQIFLEIEDSLKDK